MNSVLFIVGPTAIGKTYLSIFIAERFQQYPGGDRSIPGKKVEIVSADSRQIYKFLDIGTAKPSKDILKSIPHHFINFMRPEEYFSAGMYSRLARRIINQIITRGNIPLVVGGSGLYIKALIDGLFNIDIRDEKIRNSLRKRMLKEGVEKLYEELAEIDPSLADKIKKSDKQRIIRGLEVFLVSGQRLSDLQETASTPADFKPYLYGLTAERKFLYERIHKRIDDMFQEGFLAEVAGLKLKGYTAATNALNTVGYKEAFRYMDNAMTYDDMISLVKRNSRRYAKRQLTWFNRDKRIKWIEIKEDTDFRFIAEKIVKEFMKKSKIKK
jgi:tRNA dimethylallyltransferase